MNKDCNCAPVERNVRLFVTAKLLGVDDCRQGVLIEDRENSIIVQGMLGIYECEKNYSIVPFSNLWGDAKEFAIRMGVMDRHAGDGADIPDAKARDVQIKMTEQNKATNPEFLFTVLGEIVTRIERCGASPELTHAVSLASDLRQAIGNQRNPSNNYALERVQAALTDLYIV